jgi:hypothetical protein
MKTPGWSIVEDVFGKEFVLNSKEVSLNSFIATDPEFKLEPFVDPA